jgi:hypothetical protein
MITQRFRPIGWVVGIAVAIMLLYVIQLQVANERGKLNEVDTQIAMLRKDIRRLNTEFNTRASMRQLERWNSADDQLALAAPQARQFVSGEDRISEIGAERFEGHGVAPPPAMMQASVARLPEAETVPEAVVQTAGLGAASKSATIAIKPATSSVLEDKSKPEPRLTAHDRQAQRELSGRPQVRLSALKPEKLASVTKKSLLDSSSMKLLEKGAKAETAPAKRKTQ